MTISVQFRVAFYSQNYQCYCYMHTLIISWCGSIPNLSYGQITHKHSGYISFTLAIMDIWQFRCSSPVEIRSDKKLTQSGVDVNPRPAPWFENEVSMEKSDLDSSSKLLPLQRHIELYSLFSMLRIGSFYRFVFRWRVWDVFGLLCWPMLVNICS